MKLFNISKHPPANLSLESCNSSNLYYIIIFVEAVIKSTVHKDLDKLNRGPSNMIC